MSIPINVIIATCNRPDRLVTALDSVAGAIDAASGAKHRVIVSDNGPHRPAAEAVEAYKATASFPITYVTSAPLSKAAALNVGIAAADDGWLAFTDDDCTPDASWLREGGRYAQESGVRLFSGRLQAGPVDFALPSWLPRGSGKGLPWSPAFVDFAPRPEDCVLEDDARVPFGANIFVERSVFDEFGGYDEQLWDQCGAAALGSEDAEFAMRVRDKGLKIGFCHDALVVHPVYPERTTLKYYLRHIYHYGVREPYFEADTHGPATLYRLRQAVSASLRSVAYRLRGKPVDAMRELMDATQAVGEIAGWRRYRAQLRAHVT